jgi:hypothetical protein
VTDKETNYRGQLEAKREYEAELRATIADLRARLAAAEARASKAVERVERYAAIVVALESLEEPSKPAFRILFELNKVTIETEVGELWGKGDTLVDALVMAELLDPAALSDTKEAAE